MIVLFCAKEPCEADESVGVGTIFLIWLAVTQPNKLFRSIRRPSERPHLSPAGGHRASEGQLVPLTVTVAVFPSLSFPSTSPRHAFLLGLV